MVVAIEAMHTDPVFTPVRSSNIAAVAHDGTALLVRFTNGATYRYPGCDVKHHVVLLATDSPGRYFHREVRLMHRGERVE